MTGHSALSTRPSQLPKGYKQTEVGVIPEDWEVRPLASLQPVVTSGSRGWAEFYSDRGDSFIRITNLSRNSIELDLTDLRFVTLAQQASEANRTKVQIGDVLISITADIGIVGYISEKVPRPAYINQHIALVRFDQSKVVPKFISYFLSSSRSQKLFRAFTDAGAKAGMNLATVQQIRTALPPTLAEQEAIAEALSDADALIDSLEQLIAKKRLIKQGAMQELLTGKRRLPGFSGEWEVKRLGEVAQPRRERIDPRYSSPHEFCIELEHIEPGTGCLIGYTATSGESSLKSVFRSGDVLFGKLRAYLRKYWLADQGGVCSTEIWALVGNPLAVTPGFLYQLVRVDRFIEVASTAYGTHMPRSDWNVVMKYEVHLPPVAEQTAIASVLNDMDAEIVALKERLEKARLIKQGMMQELLTGRVRLVRTESRPIVETGQVREGNIHFRRSVLAAEIIDQLHDQPTFGHVKFEKMIFLVEHLCDVDTGSTYHRQAAGPYDNRALRSIDSQLRKQQWFDARKEGGRYRYVPMKKRGAHKPYFDRYFSGIGNTFGQILETFKPLDTERCEIVATLLAAWSDLLGENEAVSDERIVHEVLNNWHESKQRITEDRWIKALGWMKEKGFVPKGVAQS
ncbi:MAG: hypothetical protein F9K24_12995 [Leptonema illini]|uniref:Type I restriction modification DNA specificity domain-containing protein n=1 Tax=Leptonema illini TaxID=183 RepID=A0A833H161_9LEPT|nr:MAG: hypothetical protein F9K24_12995 [Leptonema illini]